MSSLKIAVCGGGNGAHACAALMSLKGHQVGLFSPLHDEIEQFSRNYLKNGGLDARIVDREVTGISLDVISDDPKLVIPQASVIFVIVPSFAHKALLRHIADCMDPEALVVVLPCRGLLELELRQFLPNAKVMAFQTLPWACRLEELGQKVDIKGIKQQIQAACRPAGLSDLFYHLLEELLDMRVERVHSMLTMTFANIGQIFHPGIMYGQFKDDPYRTFSMADCPLFYQGVTAEGADILQRLADEILETAVHMKEHDPSIQLEKILSPTQWLLESYAGQIADTASLQKMLNSNAAYQGIKIPVTKVGEDLYHANFNARYITEDVPFSLLVTRNLAGLLGVSTPTIDEVITGVGEWVGCDYLGQLTAGEQLAQHSRLPVFFGCCTVEDLF